MNRPYLLTPIAIGLAAGVAFAAPAAADGPREEATPTRCQVLDTRGLHIQLKPSGQLKLVYDGDDYVTCNEWMVVTSYASSGPVVDHSVDPEIDEIVFTVADLESAGPAGVTVKPELDPCWGGLQVHRDGDTLLWEHVTGDGCEMEISTDFAASGWDTEIHVVQQSGNIQPPHIFHHDHDQTTVLTGLPDGTWYVKVYDGGVPGTTISIDAGAPQATTTVHGVADGSAVEIAHPLPVRRADSFLAPG